MKLTLAYRGRSALRGDVLNLAANLGRDRVAFDARLLNPLRFREAISALHDIVINDLRAPRRDRSAYKAWQAQEAEAHAALSAQTLAAAQAEVAARSLQPLPPGLQASFDGARARYWRLRQAYGQELMRRDPALFRRLMPCDPIISVADDALTFEGFSRDEASYGCLIVGRDEGFSASADVALGTTNVDYSWELYEHFQNLRSTRETRFQIDPAGFASHIEAAAEVREEAIDLPASWLRGFLEIQSAMALPLRRVVLSRDALYSVLAFLRRHRARVRPRALRFELEEGRPPRIVIEPWERVITDHGGCCEGPSDQVRLWGRDRLKTLARVLPLAERVEVFTLGTGLPSFWCVVMGEMRLILGLSGWTANDWTRGAAMSLLAPSVVPDTMTIERVSNILRTRRRASFAELVADCFQDSAAVAAALAHLAHTGQVLPELGSRAYRWRAILPFALGEAQLGPEHPELSAARELLAIRGRVRVTEQKPIIGGGAHWSGLTGEGKAGAVTLELDAEGAIRAGACGCSYYFQNKLRKGPCRHLLALRGRAAAPEEAPGAPWWSRF